jgi:hypothetical protein
MRLNVNYDFTHTYDDVKEDEIEKLVSQFKESIKNEPYSSLNANSFDLLLKKVETNKTGLMGMVKLFPIEPQIENSLAIVYLFNRNYKETKDLRFLNASLKLIDLLDDDLTLNLKEQLRCILFKECSFIRQIEF